MFSNPIDSDVPYEKQGSSLHCPLLFFLSSIPALINTLFDAPNVSEGRIRMKMLQVNAISPWWEQQGRSGTSNPIVVLVGFSIPGRYFHAGAARLILGTCTRWRCQPVSSFISEKANSEASPDCLGLGWFCVLMADTCWNPWDRQGSHCNISCSGALP